MGTEPMQFPRSNGWRSGPLITRQATCATLERDDFSSNRHRAPSFCLSMIFSENRYPLFRIMHLASSLCCRSNTLTASPPPTNPKNGSVA